MKFSPGQSLRRAAQLTDQIYEKAEVQSAYDCNGHLKFLVARIPRADFARLYGTLTFATLFHRGHWVQFSRAGKSLVVSERAAGARFHLEMQSNSFGWAQVTLQRKGNVVWRRTLTPEELEGFELTHDLLQAVARVCAKLCGEVAPYSDDGRVTTDVPSIHILPEMEDRPEFMSAAVDLQ